MVGGDFVGGEVTRNPQSSLRASSPIWASEASLARTRERAAEERPSAPRSRVLSRLTRRACSQATPRRRGNSREVGGGGGPLRPSNPDLVKAVFIPYRIALAPARKL